MDTLAAELVLASLHEQIEAFDLSQVGQAPSAPMWYLLASKMTSLKSGQMHERKKRIGGYQNQYWVQKKEHRHQVNPKVELDCSAAGIVVGIEELAQGGSCTPFQVED